MMETKAVCEPICSFEEVIRYEDLPVPKKIFHTFPSKPISYIHNRYDCHIEGETLLPRIKFESRIVPKTLVCHDMKGGYLEDRYINGCTIGNGYTFYHWQDIDIFIYFSHHLVTIPPKPWIKLAHKNNVKILGTFITEYNNGVNVCAKIFEDESSWTAFANGLVNIALVHNFDGWFLNIENPITDTVHLLCFVKYLRETLKQISPDMLVIWYDSVTKNGDLKWQNELNENNMCYFDVCDGIFLNYSWNEKNLTKSLINAGKRFLDVYVGIDVFGRNFYKGGGFNCDLAAEVIRRLGLSMAIFAQGWTHETLRPKSLNNFHEIFLHKDNAFWLKLYPYLYTRPIDKGFVTTFYTGADKDTYNLNMQEQILHVPVHCGQIYFTDDCKDFCDCVQLYPEGCKPKRLSYFLSVNKPFHRLFSCSILIMKKLKIELVVKEGNKENKLEIALLMVDSNARYSEKKLTNSKFPTKIRHQFEGIGKGWSIKEYEWLLDSPVKLLEIGLKLDNKAILLGGFALEIDNYVN